MSRTYKSRPPATARAARRAWDYFAATKAKTRGIKELFYSRHYDLDAGAHWVCILNMRPNDLDHWKFSESDLTWAVSCYRLSGIELPTFADAGERRSTRLAPPASAGPGMKKDPA